MARAVLKSNLPKVAAEISARLAARHKAAAFVVQNEAKRLCPVDTGRLRSSITHELRADGARVGTPVEYGPHVELGTTNQPAQPYLVPAVVNSQAKLRQIYGGRGL